MSEDGPSTRIDHVLPLDALIRSRMEDRGWSYSDLARRSGQALTRGRWQQLGSGLQQRKFPDPSSLTVIADALEIDITTVVLGAARTLGLNVRPNGAGMSQLLPDQTERLSPRMRDAVLAVIRAAVADTLRGDDAVDLARLDALVGLRLEWPKDSAPSQQSTAESDHPGAERSDSAPGRCLPAEGTAPRRPGGPRYRAWNGPPRTATRPGVRDTSCPLIHHSRPRDRPGVNRPLRHSSTVR